MLNVERIGLLLLAFHFYFAFANELSIKHIGKYVVEVAKDHESAIGRMTIRRGSDRVLELSGIGEYFYFGNHFDFTSHSDHYSGRDFLKTGHPVLVVSRWSGGAHCCHFVNIYEMGHQLRSVATVQANSSAVRMRDLDHDGIPEIEFWDGAIDYLFSSFASSPGGHTILKYRDGEYQPAFDLMAGPLPSAARGLCIVHRLRTVMKGASTDDLPREFLEVMMDLSYSGHLQQALKLAADVWPGGRPGLVPFQSSFAKALRESKYAPH